MALTAEEQALDFNPELQDVGRQRKLAELLMAQGMQQPQGQMISGHYVAPSWAQSLNPMANILAGQAIGERADTKQLELATALRGRQQQEINKFSELLKVDPNKAYQFAAQSQVPQLREVGLKKMMPQEFDLAEGAKRYMTMPDGSVKEIAAGTEKYRAPTSVDMGTMGTMLIYPDGRREVVQKGREGPAGQVVETENGPMLVNTRTGQAQPIMAGGQAIAGSPKLTETQSNATAFGMRAKEANKIVTALEDKGITNTGIIRSAISGTVGMAPFVGGKMEQGVQSAMNVLPGAMGGPNEPQQQTDQGRRNFISAVLRKESGATIPPDEYANEEKKYFPQVGDGPKVIKQKQEARELAIKALEIQAGPGAKQIRALGTDTGVVDFNSLPKRGQ
jgi:hypothetical protein